MGLMRGTAGFTRYMAETTLPPDFMEGLSEEVSRYAFRNLDEASADERSAGWVNIMDMFDNRFSGMEFLKEPYVALSLRIDERKVPATALRQYAQEAEEAVRKEEGLTFLSKGRRAEIREAVRLKLMRRAIPVAKTYDMIWNLNTGLVVFGSTNARICDEFAERFYHTFRVELRPVCPYTLGERYLEGKGEPLHLLDGLSPSRFLEEG